MYPKTAITILLVLAMLITGVFVFLYSKQQLNIESARLQDKQAALNVRVPAKADEVTNSNQSYNNQTLNSEQAALIKLHNDNNPTNNMTTEQLEKEQEELINLHNKNNPTKGKTPEELDRDLQALLELHQKNK